MTAVAHTEPRLGQKLIAEFAGTAMLLCTVIGSGIMAETLSGGNVAIALLANTLATVLAQCVGGAAGMFAADRVTRPATHDK